MRVPLRNLVSLSAAMVSSSTMEAAPSTPALLPTRKTTSTSRRPLLRPTVTRSSLARMASVLVPAPGLPARRALRQRPAPTLFRQGLPSRSLWRKQALLQAHSSNSAHTASTPVASAYSVATSQQQSSKVQSTTPGKLSCSEFRTGLSPLQRQVHSPAASNSAFGSACQTSP